MITGGEGLVVDEGDPTIGKTAFEVGFQIEE